MQFHFGGFSLWKGSPVCKVLLWRIVTGLVDLEVTFGTDLPFGFGFLGISIISFFFFGDFPLKWFGLVCLLWFVHTDF